jgi:hypothetical protein
MPSQIKPLTFSIFTCFIAGFLFGNPVPARALQEDPFGDPFGNTEKGGAQKQDDDPFNVGGKQPAKNPASLQKKSGTIKLPKTVDNVVLAIRETNPTTPADFIQALRIMFDTQNYDEAKLYLEKLETEKVSDAVAFQLVKEIGSDFIIRLIRSEPMAPKGAVYGRSLLVASTRHLKSDAQLETYLRELISSSPATRQNAFRGFQLAGTAGLGYLIKNSSEGGTTASKTYEVAAALIGSSVIKPLIAVLETGSLQEKIFAIGVLGRVNARKGVPFLLGPLFDQESPAAVKTTAENAFKRILGGAPSLLESKMFLRRKITELIKGGQPFTVDASGATESWTWSADKGLIRQHIKPEVARVLMMERLGRALYSIDPADHESETLFLATQLTAIKTLRTKPVSESLDGSLLAAFGSKKWIGILEFCLKNKLMDGATAAVEMIGKVGNESLLRTSDFSPLVRAMQAGDRQLRYASTEAIININPKKAFPGASHFVDSVVYFAGTRGYSRALVAHPKFSEGQNLVGTLAKRGFAADSVTTGRDLFRLATQDSDVEFILISDAIDHPNLGELLVQLRSQPSLSSVPIGILSQKINHEKNVHIANTDPKTHVMKQPYRISFRVEQLLPEDNREINNAIITWSVLSDLLEKAIEQNNRSVSIQLLETMKVSYNDDLSKLAVDNSAIVSAMSHSDLAIRSRASKLFIRVTGVKPLYEKPIEQPTASGRVLIVHPQSGEILPLQNKLEEVGFGVAVINSVDQAIKVIPSLQNLRFVIGSQELGGLAETQLRQALTKKYRLHPVPITFVARADSYRESPVAKPVFDMQLESLLELGERRPISGNERILQAKTCLAFLRNVIADRKSYAYANPIRHEKKIVYSLQNPALTKESLAVLQELATPTAQKAIVDFASENSRPAAERTAAVKAFAGAIQKRGILLTKAAILEQYARYNQSEALDQQSQQVLSSLLDAIEAPTKAN